MNLLALALLGCLSAAGQEERPAETLRLRAEAAQALEATARAGTFEVAGQLKTEVREDQTEDEPTVGQVTGSVSGSPFEAALRVTAEHNVHDLYYRHGKLAGRLVWRSAIVDLGKSPSELLSLLKLDRLALFARKALSAQAGPGEAVEGKACRSLRLRLPADTIRGHSEDNDAVEEDEKGLDGVDLELSIDPASGTVVRLAAKVRRAYTDPQNPAASQKASSSCELLLRKLGQAKVVIPEEIERQLRD